MTQGSKFDGGEEITLFSLFLGKIVGIGSTKTNYERSIPMIITENDKKIYELLSKVKRGDLQSADGYSVE